MSPVQWEQVKTVFDAALDFAPEQRAGFLATACCGDTAVLDAVESLLAQDETAGDFLETPMPGVSEIFHPNLHPAQRFSPDEMLAGRFRIVRLLGTGGMGEVYEAEDRELNIHVALKTVRPEIAVDERNLVRLRQEVQLARRVTHPNVCRLYDVSRDGPLVFLTMELLVGETLSNYLRRVGRISSAEALPLIEQMAEALHAEHAAGVVHRDFKSSNVMLVPDETGGTRVAVTDFGMASSAAPGDEKQTGAGVLLGTPAYMAPEQFTGGSVTCAADIYALGVVMYEMVTGEVPFHGEAIKRLKQPPLSPREHAPDLDPRWEAVILRCLAIDPAERFGDACEVEAALAPEKTSEAQRHRGLAVRIVAPLAIFVFLMALSFGIFRMYQWKGGVPPGSRVLLTSIENLSGDKRLDGVTEALRSQLSQSPHFELIGDAQIAAALRLMVRQPGQKLDAATIREVAVRQGAPLVVYGSLTHPGADYVLGLKVEKMGSGPYARSSAKRRWHASSSPAIFDAIHEGSDWVRRMAGEAAAELGAENRRPEETTTNSWEALKSFSEAEERKANDHPQEAIVLLQEAIEKDPQFALAWMRAGDISFSLHRSTAGFKYWKGALEVMNSRRLTTREELRIRGSFAMEAGSWAQSEMYFRRYAAHYPNDYLPLFYLARPLMMQGRVEEAIDALLQAASKRPDSQYVLAHLARYSLLLSRYDRASEFVNRLEATGHSETALPIAAEILFLKADYAGALRSLDVMSRSENPDVRSRSYSIRACLLSELGQRADAAAVLQEGIEFDTAKGKSAARSGKLLSLAYLAWRNGDRDAVRKYSLEALRLDGGLSDALQAGTLLARSGFTGDAEDVLRRMDGSLPGPILESARYRVAGEIAIARRLPARAMAEFRSADSIEAPFAPREYLARALSLSGDAEAARAAYRRIAEHPEHIWELPDGEFPGLCADARAEYLHLSQQ